MRGASSYAGSTRDRSVTGHIVRARRLRRATSEVHRVARWYWAEGPGPGATLHRPMRTALLLYALAVVVRTACMIVFPDPAYADSSYYVEVARSLASGHGLSVDFVWIFAEVGGTIPARPGPAGPIQRPLAAPGVVHPGAVRGPVRPDGRRVGHAHGPHRGPGRAADLGHRPRCRRVAPRPAGRRGHGRHPGGRPRVHGPAGELRDLPAARRGDPVAGRPRPARRRARLRPVRASWSVWPRWPATTRSCSGPPSGSSSSSIAGGPGGPAGRPALPVLAAVGCFGLFMLVLGPWWARQLLEFGSISPTASNGQALWLTEYRQWNSTTADHDLRRVHGPGLGHHPEHAADRTGRLAGQLRGPHLVDHPAAAHPHRGLGAAPLRRLPAVLPVLRHPAGRGDHHLPAACPGRRVHPHRRRARTALVHPGPGGRRPGHRGHRPAPARLGPAGRDPAVHLGRGRVRRRQRGPVCADRVGELGGDARAAAGRGRRDGAPGHPGRGPAHDHRRRGLQVLDRPWRRGLARRPDRAHRGGRPGLRHPLAGPGATGRRRGPASPSLRDDVRPAWIGPAVYTLPSDDPDGIPALALYPVCTTAADTRCAVAGS